LRSPADPEALLSEIYGDFMRLPPPNQRVRPHRIVGYALEEGPRGRQHTSFGQ
jgi:hypothetical protein